jgi:hypothetical protein
MKATIDDDLSACKLGEAREGGGGCHGVEDFENIVALVDKIFQRGRERLVLPASRASDLHRYGDPVVHPGQSVVVDLGGQNNFVFGTVITTTRGTNASMVVFADMVADGHGGWENGVSFRVPAGQLVAVLTSAEAKLLTKLQKRLASMRVQNVVFHAV